MKSKMKTAFAATAVAFTAGAATAEIEKIGLAVPNLQADFFNQIKLGVENYAAEKGIEVIVVDAKNDTATQVSQVQDLMTQGIDAFIYIPAGAAAGQKGTTPEVLRFEGCKRAIDENPGIELVTQQWSQMWSPDEGFSIAQNMLQANPDLKLIFGQADGLAMGAAKAVDVAGLSDQVIIGGYDGDVAALEYLAKCEGPFIVTATQSTQLMGRLAVDSAIKVAAGEEVPERQIPNAVLTTCEDAPAYVEQHP